MVSGHDLGRSPQSRPFSLRRLVHSYLASPGSPDRVTLCSFLHPPRQAVPASLLGHVSSAPLLTAGPDVRGPELSGFPSPASLPTALLIQD